MGKLTLKAQHRLLIDDSTKEENLKRLMGGTMADLTITDPPYNVAYTGKTKDALTIQNDSMSDEGFLEFLTDVFKATSSAIKPGAAVYVAHADSEGFNFRYAMKLAGFKIRECLIWVKNCMVMGRQDYQWRHEPILYTWKEGGAHNWYSDRKQTTILEFNKPSKSLQHPTTKPVELWEYLMQNSSKPGDIVLDQFMGSGTTFIAAERLGRHAYGLELDERYAQAILERYQKFSGKKAVREDGTSLDELLSRTDLTDMAQI